MNNLNFKLIHSKFFLSIIFFISISVSQLSAQPGIGISYTFSKDTGVITPAVITNQVVSAANQDDFAFRFSPAGMNIRFGCISYTNFVASTNGWLALLPAGIPGGIPASLSAGSYLSSNQLSNNTTGFPILAPFWDDLSTTIISFSYVAPVLTVQWTCRINKTAIAAANNFWVRMDGNTGVITYSYANNPAYVVAGPPSASIGIAGICSGDYYSYDNVSTYSDTTLETTTIATKPVNVQYIFTPYQVHDNCTNAKELFLQTDTCIPETYNINNAVSSGPAISCSVGGNDSLDIWFKISKPAGTTTLTVTTSPAGASCQNLTGTTIEAYSTCGGIPINCSTTSSTIPTFGELTLTRPSAPEQLYFRVTADNDVCGKFNICATTSNCVAVINSGNDTIDDCGTGSVDLHVQFDSSSTYLWTLNGNTVSVADTITATQPGMYHVSVTGGTCPGSDSVFVNFISPITLTFTGLDTVNCVNDIASILLPNYTPGTFSGPGINGNTFDPSLAGIGTHTITYDYTTAGGCHYTTSQTTRVDACLNVPVNRLISLDIFPNPNPGDFYVFANINKEKKVKMNIKDMSGRILKSDEVALKAGENKISVHSALAKGIYLFTISDEFDSVSLKMIIN